MTPTYTLFKPTFSMPYMTPTYMTHLYDTHTHTHTHRAPRESDSGVLLLALLRWEVQIAHVRGALKSLVPGSYVCMY
jgi:hypothetical protein